MSNQKTGTLTRKVLEFVAKKNGVSAEEVRRKTEVVIAATKANSDSGIQVFWILIPHKGEILMPEEANLHPVEMEFRNMYR